MSILNLVRRNWIELLIPTLLIGGGWLFIGGVTTLYISWMEREFERVLSENVTSIDAVAQLQHELLRLAASEPARRGMLDNVLDRSTRSRMQAAMERVEQASISAGERAIASALRSHLNTLADELTGDGDHASGHVGGRRFATLASLMSHCEELRALNVETLGRRTEEFSRWNRRIVTARLFVSVGGPLAGMWLGYRVAVRLRRRIAAIRVSLEGVTEELGTLVLAPSADAADLDELDCQVREIGRRIHEMVQQLDLARREASRNERLATLGHLAAGVAHELRNPLTAVKLLVQTAAGRSSPAALSAQQLSVIQTEIARMEDTIQNLLDFARPVPARKVPADLRDILRRALNLVDGRARHERVALDADFSDVALPIVGDPEQLHQVIVNLLFNGIDAMPGGGVLRIETQRFSRDSPKGFASSAGAAEPSSNQNGRGAAEGVIRINDDRERFASRTRDCELSDHPTDGPTLSAAARDGGEVIGECELRVVDSGPGIDHELLERIFEPFVTTKTRGTGLGLAISRRIVEEHGGRLLASNRPSGGAEMRVVLPCRLA